MADHRQTGIQIKKKEKESRRQLHQLCQGGDNNGDNGPFKVDGTFFFAFFSFSGLFFILHRPLMHFRFLFRFVLLPLAIITQVFQAEDDPFRKTRCKRDSRHGRRLSLKSRH